MTSVRRNIKEEFPFAQATYSKEVVHSLFRATRAISRLACRRRRRRRI